MDLSNLSDYELGGEPWASLMFLRVFSDYAEGLEHKERVEKKLHIPVGFVFISDPKYGPHTKVKLTSGRQEPEDKTPRDTAVREAYEETGISIPPESVHFADKQWKKYTRPKADHTDHWKCYFYADIFERQMRTMHNVHPGNDGELPAFLTPAALQQKIDQGLFLRDHLESLIRTGLLMPPLGKVPDSLDAEKSGEARM